MFLSQLGLVNIGSTKLPAGSMASLLSGFIAMFVTYVLNNWWTFEDRKKSNMSEYAVSVSLYYMSSYIPILLRSWLVKFLVEKYQDTFLINNIGLFIGIMFGLVWNYTVYSKFIWKREQEI